MPTGELRTLHTAFAILLAASLSLVSACSPRAENPPAPSARVTVFEGARLIAGDGSAPIEDSAFIVENNQFTYVGRRADVKVPAGAPRVDLSGQTAIPPLGGLQWHTAVQNIAEGTLSKAVNPPADPIVPLRLPAPNR